MKELSLFSGAGGGLLGSLLLGWETVGYVEFNDNCQQIISQRIENGILHRAPIFGDIKAFLSEGYAESYKGMVDIISGGFPCQDISSAGGGKGLDEGERSGLWREMADVVRQVKPRYVFVENSPMLTIRGLGTVLRDLAEMGYDARWGCLSSENTGAIHKRERIWIVADSFKKPRSEFPWRPNKELGDMGNDIEIGSFIDWYLEELERQGAKRETQGTDSLPSYLCRIPNAMAPELDELKAIGNGQDPICMVAAFRLLSDE
ncbi:MAG: DNA cytosine methyltransferase [Proteobacteria bacterium]|nr:DNA cytosine methyltransferase [Pseudomonadota bacterium]